MRRVRSAALALCAFAACVRAPRSTPVDHRPATAPVRIVAGSVFAAEVLLAIAPRERLAGVHALAADPRWSLVAGQVGALPQSGPEPEQLLALRPDLVISDAYTRAETQILLEAAGVPVVRIGAPASFADVAGNLRRLGLACWCEEGAERLVAGMAERLAAVRTRADEVAGWRLCCLDGSLHSHGRGSLFDAVVMAAGAQNVAAQHGVGAFRRLDVEEVLRWRPDALVLAAQPGEEASTRAWIDQHPGLRLLPCVRQGRLLFVPDALLATTSHHLAEAAAFVQERLRAWGRP